MSDNERLTGLLTTLSRFAALDFEERAPIGPDGDVIDAVAAGINMLAEEVRAGHDELEEQVASRTTALTVAVSELEHQRDLLARLAAVMESTTDAVLTVDDRGRITSSNAAARRTYGYSAAELHGQSLSRLAPFGTSPAEVRGLLRQAAGSRLESVHLHKDGTRFPVSVMVTGLGARMSEASEFAIISRDITETKRSELLAQRLVDELAAHTAELRTRSLHDALTGLANRSLLKDRLDRALARRDTSGLAVLMIDLDDFKSVNDSMGHAAGDEVLVQVAHLLVAELRGTDTVARAGSIDGAVGRLGGDEFVVLLESMSDPGVAGEVAERVLEALSRPMPVAGRSVELGASIGIAVAGVTPSSAEILLGMADAAMYAAKRGGKGRYRVFEPSMRQQALDHADTVRDLRHAISQGQLRLLYQPQVDVTSGRLVGVEALVRWAHPTRGLLGPDSFIPAAEASGCIVALDDWVIFEACRQQRIWQDHGLHLQMAVNVSGRSLFPSNLARRLAAAIAGTGALAHRLEVEITETAAVADGDATRDSLEALRAMGVTVAIDDFGMGHSALSRLKEFPVDCLKIDRFFIASLAHDGTEVSSIAAAMIAMADAMDLRVVAEGVETLEQLESLRVLGCPTVQGYLLSRPVPAEEIETLTQQPLIAPEALRRTDLFRDRPQDRLIHSLLAELQRLTGFDSTYFAHTDERTSTQRVLLARNTGLVHVPEGALLPWSDDTYRSAMERGISHGEDVPDVLGRGTGEPPDFQTWAGVDVVSGSGKRVGMLCGGSSGQQLTLGSSTLRVMSSFADLIGQAHQGDPVPRSGDEAASDRDDLADRRDRAADVRDEEAAGRDVEARRHDAGHDGPAAGLQRAEQRRGSAAADRAGARSDRGEAAGDREEAAHQRAEAAADGAASAEAARRAVVSLESMTDAFHTLDQDWNITYLNPQCEVILNRRRADLLGKNLWEEFPEALGTRFHGELHRAVSQQTNVRFTEYYEPLGSTLEVRAYPFGDGLAVYFRGVDDKVDR